MKKIISITVTVFFLLILITDLHYKFLRREALDGLKFTLLLKTTIGIILTAFMVLLNPFKKHLKSYIALLLLMVCAGISNYISYYEGADISQTVYIQTQYLFGLVVTFFFFNNYNYIDYSYLKKVISFLIVVNLGCILLGYLFDFSLFRTYVTRFGFNGIFKSTSEAAYFYMFSFILYLNKKDRLEKYVFLSLIAISSLMVGSKTLYFFLSVSFIYIFIMWMREKFNIKPPIILSIAFGMFMTVGFLIMKFLLPLNNELFALYKEEGFITLFFSFRDQLMLDAIDILEQNFSFINYIFGGLAYVPKTTEMAIMDLFLAFGIVGLLLYLYVIVANFPKFKCFNVYVLGFVIIASICLRGNFFYFPSVIYISMAIFAFTLNQINLYKRTIPTDNESNLH